MMTKVGPKSRPTLRVAPHAHTTRCRLWSGRMIASASIGIMMASSCAFCAFSRPFFELGQVAVHIQGTIRAKAFRQGGLATTADAAQPGHGNLPPSFFFPVNPKWPVKHASIVCVQAYQM